MPHGDGSSRLDQLSARLETLERRIAALENPRLASSADLQPSSPPVAASSETRKTASPATQANVLSIFGRAILGIAGAYLLRAAAESTTVPPGIAVTAALAYAAAWLSWAARPGMQSRLARHSYALTAALILSPLMWEATVSFRMLSPPAAAAILAAFALLAMALGWRFDAAPVVWIGVLSTTIMSLILMVGTRSPAPFTAALLVMASASEFAASRGRWGALRPFVAVAADFAVLILIIILGNVEAIPPEYHPVPAGALIFLAVFLWGIYAVSIGIRSLGLRLQVKGPEAAQFLVALLLAGLAVWRITRGAGLPTFALCCFAAGAACYFAAFRLITQRDDLANFRFFAVFAVAFVLAGCFFSLPVIPLVVCMCLAAVIATGLSVHVHSAALDLHGVAYLTGALFASGLLQYAASALVGALPSPPGPLPLASAVSALICAVVVSQYPGERRNERVLRLLPSVLAVYATAGLAVGALVWLTTPGSTPTLPQLAVVRTIVTCASALLLAYLGARRSQAELIWMAYAVAVLGSLKLVLEDLRLGSKKSLAVSLLIYGAVLILIPRLARFGKQRN